MKNVLAVVDNYSKIEHFYPDDLPSDWQLDYYLNEFDSLFLDKERLNQFTNSEEIEEQLQERETSLNVIFAASRENVAINLASEHITSYFIEDLNTLELNPSTKQGVDSLRVFWVDFLELEDLKSQGKFCQSSLLSSNAEQNIFLIKTPCTIKQVKDFEILLNLII